MDLSMAEFWAVFLIGTAVGLIVGIKIIQQAGYPGWWILAGMIPIVGTVLLLVFAFSKWPVTQRLEACQARNVGYGSDAAMRGGGAGGLRSDQGGYAYGGDSDFTSLAQTKEDREPVETPLPPFRRGSATPRP